MATSSLLRKRTPTRRKGVPMTILPTEAQQGFALSLAASLRPNTVRGYLEHLGVYLHWCGDRNPYARDTVLAYLGDVAARCSRSTLATYHKALRAFFGWCEAEGVCANAMRGIKPPRLSPDDAERDAPVYTEADRAALLAVCPPWTWMGLRNRALILSLWHTPLRASELTGLLVTDIDWEGMEITVRSGKGGVRYTVVLPVEMAEAVHRYLRHRPDDIEGLWLSEKGTIMTPRALSLTLKRLAKRAGITQSVYPHAFRHRWRIQCVMMGMTDVEIASLMGQRTVRATQGYGRKVLQAQARARYRERLAG
ncbi:hypothetical protein LCGC14_2112880 [marine sediment metagenome]|uniref:Tyr recombinase domain-containing protein n=1 Tax=marine sediment metagenome TaxID=412755 RepID=A0A0F9GJP9_9ZZZZ